MNLSVLSRLAYVLLCGASLACSRSHDASPPMPASPVPPARPVNQEPALAQAPASQRAEVTLVGTQGQRKVQVEVVASPRAVERGLMYRTHLPVDDGMLFLMGEEDIQSFWMRNTLIPLDILFIDKGFKVVGIVENATPRTETSRTVGLPSTYVLEVNGGWCAKNGVATGASVRFSDNVEAVAH